MEQLIKLWPIAAGLVTAGAAASVWALTMLWKIAEGVSDVRTTLQHHHDVLVEHKAELVRLDLECREHGLALAVARTKR